MVNNNKKKNKTERKYRNGIKWVVVIVVSCSKVGASLGEHTLERTLLQFYRYGPYSTGNREGPRGNTSLVARRGPLRVLVCARYEFSLSEF